MALLDKTIARRDFLRAGVAAAAVAAGASAFGCAPSQGGQGASQTDGLSAHVVESDVAILEGKGKWVSAPCLKGCNISCGGRVYVVDGVPVRTGFCDYLEDGEVNIQYRPCQAYKSNAEWLLGPSRIKYPMKRKHWSPGGGENVNGELRGKDEWERITWDEAYDMIASEIKRIYGEYGPWSTIWFLSAGAGIKTILSMMGGFIELGDTISAGVMSGDVAWFGTPSFDTRATPDWSNFEKADYFVITGMDFTFTQNSTGFYMTRTKEAGVPCIYVGPCYNSTASMLDARWIPVRPGTDTAFWTGVAYEMVKLDEDRGDVIDYDVLNKYSVGFDMDHMPADAKLDECYKGYLLGEYDGLPKTAEWSSRICGATPQDIRDMAAIMSKQNDVLCLYSNGVARNIGAENFPPLIRTIALMGGHVNSTTDAFFNYVAGSGTNPHARSGARGRGAAGMDNPLQYEENPGTNLYGLESSGRVMLHSPGFWRDMLAGEFVSYGGESNQYPPIYNEGVKHTCNIKFIWNGTRNYLSSRMDLFNAVKVYRNCDFVLSQKVHACTDARFSDIVLPVASDWEGSPDHEENCYTSGSTNRYNGSDFLPAVHPVCEPLWEARSDNRIWRDIAERLGFNPDDVADGDALQAYWNDMAGASYDDPDDGETKTLLTLTQEEIDKYDMRVEPQEGGLMSYEEFQAQGGFFVPRTSTDVHSQYNRDKAFYEDPEANPLGSVSGLWEIYCQSRADNLNTPGFVDKDNPIKPYPNYFVPTRGYEKTFSDWENQIKGDYPYLLYTFHPASGSHGDGFALVGKESWPHPLYINPVDAADVGVETGDTVRIWNPEGGCCLRQAVVMEGTMPGCLGLAEGAGNLDLDESDPDHWIDRAGSVNSVTSAVYSNYLPSLSGYNNGIVNIEKYAGEPVVPDCERDPFAIQEDGVEQ